MNVYLVKFALRMETTYDSSQEPGVSYVQRWTLLTCSNEERAERLIKAAFPNAGKIIVTFVGLAQGII